MTDFERRTEDRPSITYPGGMPHDPHPYRTPTNRLVPGYDASADELERLIAISRAVHTNKENTLPLEILVPTPLQLARIAINHSTGCWELPVYDDPKPRARYGSLAVKGIGETRALAHRTMYRVIHGIDSIPPNMMLDHLCEHKPCCYPRHLEPVSPTENTRRGRERMVREQIALFVELN